MENSVHQLTYWGEFAPKKAPLWQGYTPDMTDKVAEAKFQEKYGYEPEGKKRYASCLLVGPIL